MIFKCHDDLTPGIYHDLIIAGKWMPL